MLVVCNTASISANVRRLNILANLLNGWQVRPLPWASRPPGR